MTDEETKSPSNITLIIIGSIIGGLIIYYLLKSKTTTPVTSPSSLQSNNISSIEINNRLDSIEQRLQQLQIQTPPP